MSIFTISEKSNLCFSNILKPDFDFSKPIEEMTIPRKGIKVSLYGFTPKTKKYKEYGANAIRNILSLPFQTSDSKGFSTLIKALEYLGYKTGLTMQPMPYNFYVSYRKNEFSINFKQNLLRLNSLNQKKVSILAHSMGNLNVLFNLQKLSQDEKNKLIQNYIAIAPVYLGAYKANKVLLSGLDELITFYGLFGFHFKAAKMTTTHQISLFELGIKDAFHLYKNEKWFQNIKKRIEYEKDPQNIPFKDSGIPFWPKYTDKCYPEKLEFFYQNCNFGIRDTRQSFIKIGDESFMIEDLERMYEQFALSSILPKIYQKVHSNDMAFYKPGVPTFLFFNNSVKTLSEFHYFKDLPEKIKENKFPTLKFIDYSFRDQTVPTFSSILPGLRWAFQYE